MKNFETAAKTAAAFAAFISCFAASQVRADWTLTTTGDYPSMTDGNGHTIYVTVLDAAARTLRLGRFDVTGVALDGSDANKANRTSALSTGGEKKDVGWGTLDLVSPITEAGSSDTWTITEIGAGAFMNQHDKFTGTLNLSTVKKIGDAAFMYDNGFTEVILSSELEEIGAGAFCGAYRAVINLSTATNLKKIGAGAFANHSAYGGDDAPLLYPRLELTSIEEIGGRAFAMEDPVRDVQELVVGPNLKVLTSTGADMGGNSGTGSPFVGMTKLKSLAFQGPAPETLDKNVFDVNGASFYLVFEDEYIAGWVEKLGGTLDASGTLLTSAAGKKIKVGEYWKDWDGWLLDNADEGAETIIYDFAHELRVKVLDADNRELRLGRLDLEDTTWGNTKNSEATAEVIGGNSNWQMNLSKPITLPGSDKAWTIVEVGAWAFKDNKDIKSVDGGLDLTHVRKIGNGAFMYSQALRRVLLSPELEWVGNSAFAGANNTLVLDFDGTTPDVIDGKAPALKFIGASAFAHHSRWGDGSPTLPANIELPAIEVIQGRAFARAKGVQTVVLGPNLKFLGGETDSGTGNIDLVISNNRFDLGAFAGLDGLTKVTFQSPVPESGVPGTTFAQKDYDGANPENAAEIKKLGGAVTSKVSVEVPVESATAWAKAIELLPKEGNNISRVTVDDIKLDQGTLDFTPVVGVTEIKASLTNTIIPVKYNSLLTGENVTADALVCTDELPAGTQLYVFQDNKYTGWLLERGAWTPAAEVSTADGVSSISIGIPAEDQTLAAGSAIWLVFPEKPDNLKVYIYGQVVTPLESTIIAGKTNLLANPTANTIDISAQLKPAKGDKFALIGDTYVGEYVYSGTDWWLRKADGTLEKNNITLPRVGANSGFWYYSKGAEDVTIKW